MPYCKGIAGKVDSCFVWGKVDPPLLIDEPWPAMRVWADALAELNEGVADGIRWCAELGKVPIGRPGEVWWKINPQLTRRFDPATISLDVGLYMLPKGGQTFRSRTFKSASRAYLGFACARKRLLLGGGCD